MRKRLAKFLLALVSFIAPGTISVPADSSPLEIPPTFTSGGGGGYYQPTLPGVDWSKY